MAKNRVWLEGNSSRGCFFRTCKGEHVNLSELKKEPIFENHRLQKKDIPHYPECAMFNVSDVCHVTEKSGFQGIIKDGGFKNMGNESTDEDFLWWSLSVTKEDIDQADFCCEQHRAKGKELVLQNFTTSPAFQSKSRYGNFKFTFPLKELLFHYARQFCRGTAPVLRVMDTRIYKTEIMYSVLVHPRHVRGYGKYPRLPRSDKGVCWYSQKKMSWRCQSPSNAYTHELVCKKGTMQAVQLQGKPVYYVWDHVAVAFHMESNWTLRVFRRRLSSCVSVCETSTDKLLKEPELSMEEAPEILEKTLKANMEQYRH